MRRRASGPVSEVGLNFVCAAIGSFIHGRKNSERSFKRENGMKRMDATGGVEWSGGGGGGGV